MVDGYSFLADWTFVKNDAGCKVDFLHPKPDEPLFDCIDRFLQEDFDTGNKPVCTTKDESPTIVIDKETRTRLINKWGAFYDVEFFVRNGHIPNKTFWNGGVNFDSPFNQVDGYGNAGEQIVRAFLRQGSKVRIADTWHVQNDKSNLDTRVLNLMTKGFDERSFPIGIRFSQPTSFGSCPGKFKIGYSMWEFPQFPESWRDGANSVNLNFVPCGWNRILWEEGNVIKPIVTIPLGIPDDSFFYVDRVRSYESPFVFIADGSILGESNFVETFKETFRDDPNVRLVLKTLPREKRETIENGNLTEIRGRLTQQELLDWYTLGECFVYPTPAEGFGLFPVEAMATGLPVIMTDLPAMATFCRKELCYPVEVEKVDWYHFPSKESLKKQMIYCYQHRDEISKVGKTASQFVHKNLTYSQTVEKIIRLLT